MASRRARRDGVRQRTRVLDVGCGAGRFMLWLRERGHEVTGIDVSPGAIQVCRERGLMDVHALSIGQVSRRLGCFDTVLLLGGNLALLGPEAQAKRNLMRLHRVTSPEGRVLGANRDWTKSEDPETRAKAAKNIASGRFSGEHRSRIRYKTFATPFFASSRMSPDELRVLVGGTGWIVREVVDRDAGIYIAVLEKS